VDYSALVVVGHYRQVLMTTLVADLVDTEIEQPIEAGVVKMIFHYPDHDSMHRFPADSKKPADAGLIGSLRQPRDDVFKIPAEAGAWPSPGNLLSTDATALTTIDSPDLSFKPELGCSQIEVAPSPAGSVVA